MDLVNAGLLKIKPEAKFVMQTANTASPSTTD
jgi:hypothetical protein